METRGGFEGDDRLRQFLERLVGVVENFVAINLSRERGIGAVADRLDGEALRGRVHFERIEKRPLELRDEIGGPAVVKLAAGGNFLDLSGFLVLLVDEAEGRGERRRT